MDGEILAALAELRGMFPKSRCEVRVELLRRGGFGVMDFDSEPKLYTHGDIQEAQVWLMDVKPSNSERGIKLKGTTLAGAMQKVREFKNKNGVK